MADRLIKTETLQDIADAIRERTEKTEKIKPSKFAEEIRTLETCEEYDGSITVDEGASVTFEEDYTEGFNDGKTEGYNEGDATGYERGRTEGYSAGYGDGEISGEETGKRKAYDAHWDMQQEHGNRIVYNHFFAGSYITEEYVNSMKYDIDFPTETGANEKYCANMFSLCAWGRENPLIDLTYICTRINFSKCRKAFQTFSNAHVDNITADFSGCDELYQTFIQNDGSGGETLTHINVKVSSKAVFNATFGYCSGLKELRFMDGSVIGQNGLDLQRSTLLSKGSWKSVITALSTETSGLSIKGSLVSVNKAFETSVGANDGSTSAEWLDLIATKSNWTINLA